ncbi:MAG: VCBS repeat-containing protein, partial [Cyclobacteriaceae bacterium]|nr:VCBS repeat-containing protein [Cyclobacteriaceae bacterium]
MGTSKYTITLLVILNLSCSNNNNKKPPSSTEDKKKEYLLTLTNPGNTNLYFTNKVLETETLNYLAYESFYNGSGVAIGDINNDGLPDIYLGGNSVFDKLYLNKGDLKFEDISKSSGISGIHSGWTTGINMVDINSDGLLDIYVCRGGPLKNESDRKNKLFINNGDLTFKESAAEYHLDNTNYSIQTA